MSSQLKSQYYTSSSLDGLSAMDAHIGLQKFPNHYHDTFQITLTQRGVFKNLISGNLLHAFENHLAITHPGEVHATVCDEKTGISFFTLYLSPDLVKSYAQNSTAPLQLESIISDPVLADNLRDIQHQLISQNQLINQSQNQLLEDSVKALIVRLTNQHLTSTLNECADERFDLNEFNHCDDKFDLATWADNFGLDKFKFLRLFKLQTGMTPNQYMIFQRIRESKNLLKAGFDLTETALTCGFYDLPHFHKHFKNIIGVTPLTYQSAHLQFHTR